jgi:Tol biopolymer transport system component
MPDISADGRYVAFLSVATNLVAGDTNDVPDVFVRDLMAGITTRASRSSLGVEANEWSSDPRISGDGRFVAFHSFASNLAPLDTNGDIDVFVHEIPTGVTTRESVNSLGAQGNEPSEYPSISHDGRFVAFSSRSSNFASPSSTLAQIYVRDRLLAQTSVASSADGTVAVYGTSHSARPQISGDGHYVAFRSLASNLVAGDTNGTYDVFVRDRLANETVRASVDSAGLVSGVTSLDGFAISADGLFVAFESWSDLVPADTNPDVNLFVHSVLTGQTTQVNVNNSGVPAHGYAKDPVLSADGRYVAFASNSSSLSNDDSDSSVDVYVRDRGEERVTPFCAGDGSIAACPCGNVGADRHGCASSFFAAGGYLGGYGVARVGADTFLLRAQLVTGNVTLFYQGDAQDTPAILDDGISCVSGAIIRLGTQGNAGGQSTYPELGDLPVSVKGLIPAGGGTRYYQGWYRNANTSFCPTATTNRTNGLIVVWAP